MSEKTEIGARIKAFSEKKGWSKSFLSNTVGIHQQNINRYLSGKSDPSRIIISLIKHGLNPDWAKTGEGEMFTNKEGSRQAGVGGGVDAALVQPPSHSPPVHQPVNAELNSVEQRLNVLEKDAKKRNADQGLIQVPLFLHACCAGDPTPTTDEIESYISIPKSWTKHPAATFACRAVGDSMIGAGIESGDIVIADQKAPVRDRCIVIASINGVQAIKRIHLQGGAIVLAPENATYQPITLQPSDELQILGIVLGIWRTLYDLT